MCITYKIFIKIVVPLDLQAMSAIRFLIVMQWRGMNYTHLTNQILQEIDKYFSENYSINFIKESNVTMVLHKEEFESCEYDSNPPIESNCIWLHG